MPNGDLSMGELYRRLKSIEDSLAAVVSRDLHNAELKNIDDQIARLGVRLQRVEDSQERQLRAIIVTLGSVVLQLLAAAWSLIEKLSVPALP